MRNGLSANACFKSLLLVSASAAALTVGSHPAQAQTRNAADLGVEEIVVTGAALSQQRAIERKRLADSILDAVSADDLGKLPDKNLSEAIDRLPGVSITIDQGEGRFVSIRGASPNLNSVTINGLAIGSVEDNSRQIPLDIIGSELLGGVEVVKAVTPDLEANAIGGYINVLTASPFDYNKDFFLFGSAQIGDEELSSNNPYAVEVSTGGTFGSDNSIGVLAGVSYSYRDYNTKGLYVDDWRILPQVPRGLPESHKFNNYSLERERLGFTGALEFKPDADSFYYIRGVYSKFDEFETRHRGRNFFGERENNITFTGTNTGIYDGQRLRTELRIEEKDKRIANYSAGGENTFGNIKLEYAGNIIDNNTTEPNENWRFQSGRIFTGSFDMGPELFVVNPSVAQWTANLNEIEFNRYQEQDNVINDDGFQLKADLTYTFEGETSGYLKGGMLWRSVEKDQDLNESTWEDGSNDFGLDAGNIWSGEYIEGTAQGQYYNAGPRIDISGIRSFTSANINDPDTFDLQAGDNLVDSTLGDYIVEEDVWAGYLMANVDVGDWRFIGGLRIEHTDVNASGFDLLNETDVTAIERDGSYTDYLPNIHIQYRPDDTPIAIRAAWTNTIGRPEFQDLSPRRETEREDDGAGNFVGSIDQGNPDLEAFESSNFDISIEYYIGDTGILSAAAFYKDISGFIVDTNEVLTNTTFQGRVYDQLTVSTPINANNGEILGVEFNYQDVWTALPAPFDGLGGGASLTLVDSEIDVPGRTEKLPFVRQADMTYSLFLFYQWDDLELNLSYDWADDILVDVGGSADTDIYDLNYGRWDFKASYQVTDNYGLFLEVQNINNQPLGEYQNNTDFITRRELYGITGYVGATLRF